MDQPLFTGNEIELLLQSAQSSRPTAEAAVSAPEVQPFDFTTVGQMSPEQTARVVELHEGFAVQMARGLSRLLGFESKVTTLTAHQAAFGEFVQQSTESVWFGILDTQSPEGHIMLQAELSSVLAIVDVLLGGAGTPVDTIRALTSIEQEIVQPVFHLFASELQKVWVPLLGACVRLEHYDTGAKVVPPGEKVLFVKFEIHVGTLTAGWTLILPAMVSNALTRKVAQQMARAEGARSDENQRRLRERLLESDFRLELFLPPSTVSVRKLAHLIPGQVVVLKPRAGDPIHLNLAGIRLFHALPVSCGARRGAKIDRSPAVPDGDELEVR